MRESEKWKWSRSVIEFLLFRFKVGAAIPRLDTRGHDWTWYRRGCADTLEKWVLFFPVVLYGIAGHSGFHGDSDGKEFAYNAGNLGSIPGSGRFLGEKLAIHSITIAWKIPWTEEPGRLQSMGSQRARHDWATSLHLAWQWPSCSLTTWKPGPWMSLTALLHPSCCVLYGSSLQAHLMACQWPGCGPCTLRVAFPLLSDLQTRSSLGKSAYSLLPRSSTYFLQ